MIAFLLEIVIAAALAWGSSYIFWWLPLIVFPIPFAFANYQARPPMPPTLARHALDCVHVLLFVGWIIAAAVICYLGFDAWWGIPLGIVLGFSGCGMMAPRRWSIEAQFER